MPQTPSIGRRRSNPVVRIACLLAACLSMAGCFTPAHLEGIAECQELRAEFRGMPTRASWLSLFASPTTVGHVQGFRYGRLVRDGVMYDEYQFAGLLAGDDNRCLRLLIPVVVRVQGKGPSVPAIVEEYEGRAIGPQRVSMLVVHHVGSSGGIHRHPQVASDEPPVMIELAVARPAGVRWWTDTGEQDDALHAQVIDRVRWRKRSGLDIGLRVVSTPLAIVGDAGLVVVGAVVLPAWLIGSGVSSIIDAMASDESDE